MPWKNLIRFLRCIKITSKYNTIRIIPPTTSPCIKHITLSKILGKPKIMNEPKNPSLVITIDKTPATKDIRVIHQLPHFLTNLQSLSPDATNGRDGVHTRVSILK